MKYCIFLYFLMVGAGSAWAHTCGTESFCFHYAENCYNCTFKTPSACEGYKKKSPAVAVADFKPECEANPFDGMAGRLEANKTCSQMGSMGDRSQFPSMKDLENKPQSGGQKGGI